jgi:hypothetical protein
VAERKKEKQPERKKGGEISSLSTSATTKC